MTRDEMFAFSAFLYICSNEWKHDIDIVTDIEFIFSTNQAWFVSF